MIAWAKELKDTLKVSIKDSTMLKWNRISRFQPKISINIDFGPYKLKTAESKDELIESFRLRHEVFFQEFQEINKSGLDFDRYDFHFDHLIIIHQETQKIIGTYRLCCAEGIKNSYTGLEFDLTEIFKLNGPHLELGRACIQKNHRRGAVISLLWRGIAEYMNLSGAQVLFGCSSLKINSPRESALVYKLLLDQGSVINSHFASPKKNFQMPDFDAWFAYFQKGLNQSQIEEAEELVPSLLKSYLKLGAKVASEPAFDRDFDCIDMLTVLKKEDLANSLARRFQVAR